MSNFSKIILFAFILIVAVLSGIGASYIALSYLKPAAILQKDIEQISDLPNQEFCTEFDVVYVESADDEWHVSTKKYGPIFVETTYAEAITFASVLTWIGYQCDYDCEEEMLNKAINEFNQVMYHD